MDESGRRATILAIALPVLMIASFVLGFFARPTMSKETKATVGKVAEVSGKIERYYPAEVPRPKLERAAVEGLLSALDPYSEYYDTEEWAEYKQRHMDGRFHGVGILIEMDRESGYLRITTPIEDTPAFAADILPGDLVIAVDGEDMKGKTLDEVRNRIKGELATKVRLTLRRAGREEPVVVELVRAVITREVVKWRMADSAAGIGYIRITDFTDMVKEFDKAYLDLHGKGMKALVIDLRFNGGGLLQAAVDLVDRFVPSGTTILTTRGKDGRDSREYGSNSDNDLPPVPLVVLVNGGSASASEIAAGALRDLKKARLVGSRSFGKGSMQTPFDLSDGSQLKLTTAKWYLPSGANVHRDEGRKDYGLQPDFLVEMSPEEEAALMRRWDEVRKIKGQGETVPTTAATDYVLDAGLELLRAELASRPPNVAPRELAKVKATPGPEPK